MNIKTQKVTLNTGHGQQVFMDILIIYYPIQA